MIQKFFIPTEGNNHKPYLLSKIAIVVYSIILLLANSFGGILGIGEAYASTISPTNVINLTNQERKAAGLHNLASNAKLSAAALAKANDMFEKQYWDHFGPNGETPWQFIRAAGYSYVYAGENLGKGFKTTEGLVEAWMASPTHRENILSGNYNDIGVAVVEGVLLGKQTILVVQMFGSLTKTVQGTSTTTPPPTTTTPPKVVTDSKKVVTPKETGEIRSIRITEPQAGQLINNPALNIKGEVSNVSGEYTVDILENNQIVGDVKSSVNTWEFDKGSDWTEGEHKITANLHSTNVKSPEVLFTLDSKAPTVDLPTLTVQKNDEGYNVEFKIIGDWSVTDIILGSEIIAVKNDGNMEVVKVLVEKEKNTKSVFVNSSDKAGNSSSVDISEYFKEDVSEEKAQVIPIINLSVRDGISVGIITMVFLLLCVEMYVYFKKGRFKDAVSDLLTIGVWWFIVAIGIFSGFSGIIT